MRTLLLLRHAKSSWDDPSVADVDRPLAPRGRRAAAAMAAHLRSAPIHPELVLCSPARRARDTLAAVRPALEPDPEVRVEPALYGADADEIRSVLTAVAPATASVMIIAHNPGLHDLAVELAGDGDVEAMAQLQVKLPTAALAVLDLGDADWAGLDRGRCFLSELVLPRRLRR